MILKQAKGMHNIYIASSLQLQASANYNPPVISTYRITHIEVYSWVMKIYRGSTKLNVNIGT